MKNTIALLLTICLAVSLATCAKSDKSNDGVSLVLNGAYVVTDEVVSAITIDGQEVTELTFEGNSLTYAADGGAKTSATYEIKGGKLTFGGHSMPFDKDGGTIIINGVTFGKKPKNAEAAKPTESAPAEQTAPNTSIANAANHDFDKVTQSIELAGELVIDGKPAFNVSPNGKYVMTGCWELYENVSGDFTNWRRIDLSEFIFPVNANEMFAVSYTPYSSNEITWSNSGEMFAVGMYRAGAIQAKFDLADLYLFDLKNRRITNLTDVDGESDFRPGDATGEAYVDYAPVFSDDDATIFFARYGTLNGEIISGIYTVPTRGGKVQEVIKFPDRKNPLPCIFYRQGKLLYSLSAPDRSTEQGVYKYEDGVQTLLVPCGDVDGVWFQPCILDVNREGQFALIADYNYITRGKDNKNMYIVNTESNATLTKLAFADLQANTEELKANSILSAFFSPNGKEIAQIERVAGLPNTISISNAGLLSFTASLALNEYDNGVGLTANYTAHSLWTSNGYIVVGNTGDAPLLIKVTPNN